MKKYEEFKKDCEGMTREELAEVVVEILIERGIVKKDDKEKHIKSKVYGVKGVGRPLTWDELCIRAFTWKHIMA